MKIDKVKYITTTLPYVNSKPHIGHTFEFVLADIIARFYKQKYGSENVFFNTGVDEHGIKVQQAALSANLPPQKYCDQLAETWKAFCSDFKIQYDNFYRTSDSEHIQATKSIFKVLFLGKNFVVKEKYKGKYCVGCESFITEKEIINNKCPIHLTDLQELEEENYFFLLSKFRNQIQDILIDKSLSEDLKNQMRDFDKISITRRNVDWGVKVDSGTLYVWFEALLNYVLALTNHKHDSILHQKRFLMWENSLIICGQDNLKFQAYILQAINLALGIPQNKQVLVHGMILDKEGKKMSKSLGNVVDPIEQKDKYGVSPLRWYLFSNRIYNYFGYDENLLISTWNSQVVDSYGNLVSRVLHLIDLKSIDTNIVFPDEWVDNFISESSFLDIYFELNDFESFKNVLIDQINKLNKYINDTKPFSKECQYPEQILKRLFFGIEIISKYIKLIIPEYASSIDNALKQKKKAILFKKL